MRGVFACAGLGVNRWRSPGDLGRRARVWVKAIGLQLRDSCGDVEMGTRGDGLWGLGPDAGAMGGRAGGGSGLPVVGHGETSPRRRGPKETPPGACGSDIQGLQSLLAAISASRSIRLSVDHWGVDVAAPGLCDDGRVWLDVGKQERGDDGEAEIFQDMDDPCAESHAASRVWHNGECFSPGRPWRRGAAAVLR